MVKTRSVLAAVLSVMTAIATGLPEVKNEEIGDG